MKLEEKEERGNFIQKFITDNVILSNPKLDKKDLKNIMSNFADKLIFIKRNKEANSVDDYIPCLFYRKKESPNFLIYFHGNSENVFQIEFYGLDFRSYLDMNIILVEYPGYFLKTNNNNSDPNIIFANSLIVYDWIKSTFKASDNQIFVCGRSLGTSSAIYLSSHRSPKALFLISAFTSVKNVGSDIFLSIFVEKIFKSIDYIEKIKCPILFIHGTKDSLISYHHSEQLYQKVKNNNNNTDIILRPNMSHNNFNLKEDIIEQIIKFCSLNKLLANENKANNLDLNEKNDLYKIPLEIKKLIESYIFDINEFEIEEKIDKKNASFLMSLNNNDRIALINDSNISIYNYRYLLDYEIELNRIKKSEVVIKSLYQMKNGNLICASEEGDIFIFKINKKGFELVNKSPFEEEIFKIGDFFEDYICLLSKNFIKIFDNSFMKTITSYSNEKTFINYCLLSKNILGLIKQGLIWFIQFEKTNNQINVIKEIRFKCKISPNTLVGTDQYLIIGGIEHIYFYDITKNFELEEKELKSLEVTCILKLHNQFLLASTNKGSIMQININENGSKEIIQKFIVKTEISSILMINYETILISGNNGIDILTIPHHGEGKKDDKNSFFNIFKSLF